MTENQQRTTALPVMSRRGTRPREGYFRDGQQVAAMRRMVKGPRRPEDVVLVHEYLSVQLVTSPEDTASRRHKASPTFEFLVDPDLRTKIDYLESNRDAYLRHMLLEQDTQFFYAGPQFCNLLDATSAPTVVDLSILDRIGNHTAVICLARQVATGADGDGIVGMALHYTDVLADEVRHLVGSLIHEDDSVSSFMFGFTEVGPGLAEVDWGKGVIERTGELDVEYRIIANTLALLAAQNVTTTTEWSHYSKADKTAAKRYKRKLRTVNVVTLTRTMQTDLDEHREAGEHPEREGWWPVKGFFRTQRVGPGRVNKRLTYVHPCRKGNLTGPNIGRVQVLNDSAALAIAQQYASGQGNGVTFNALTKGQPVAVDELLDSINFALCSTAKRYPRAKLEALARWAEGVDE